MVPCLVCKRNKTKKKLGLIIWQKRKLVKKARIARISK